jgi:hypothetical protein
LLFFQLGQKSSSRLSATDHGHEAGNVAGFSPVSAAASSRPTR